MATKVNLKLDAVKQAVLSSGSAISGADLTCEKVWAYCKKSKMHHATLLAAWFNLPMREDALGKGKPVGCQALIASGKKDLVAIGHFSQHMSTWVSTHIEEDEKAFAYSKRAKGAGRKAKSASQPSTDTEDTGMSKVGKRALAKLQESKKAASVTSISTEQAIMILEEKAKVEGNPTVIALLVSLRAFMVK